MKNIGILGDYVKTNRLLTCLHSDFSALNIFKITPCSCHHLYDADIVILNKYQKKKN